MRYFYAALLSLPLVAMPLSLTAFLHPQNILLCSTYSRLVPDEYFCAEWIDQFGTIEEIDCQIACLQSQIRRLRWRSQVHWLRGYRLLYNSVVDYKYLMMKAAEEKEAAELLECVVERLLERKAFLEMSP